MISSEQFDMKDIEEKRNNINERDRQVLDLAAHRQARLNEANTLHQFFRYCDQDRNLKAIFETSKNLNKICKFIAIQFDLANDMS